MGLFNRNSRKANAPLVSTNRKSTHTRLALEALEERAVPAIEVTTLLENTNATLPLAGSLRNAIYFGSTDPSNTITFSDYLFTDSVPTIHSPTGLALGNFTGSGHNDVVTVSNLDPSLALARNGLGNGILTAAKSLAQTTANSTAIESGFINNDSISDVVTLEDGFIRSYLGNGSGTFTKAGVVTLPGTGYTSLVLADLNNDGNLDVATASTATAGSIVMSYGDGAGNFGSPITINLSSGNITSLSLADVNADGFTDLIATGSKSEIQTLLRDSSGVTFSPLAIKSSITGSLSSIALASLDTDSFTDAVVADATGSKLTILTSLTNGSFASKYSITLPAGSLPGQIRLADLNGDNKQDLVVPLKGLNKVFVYDGNGDGTFKPSAASVDVLTPSDIRIADMTGDGVPDIVAASASSNSFGVFRLGDINRIRTVDTTNTPVSLAVGSFDGVKGADVVTTTGLYNFNIPNVGGTYTTNPGVSGLPITTPLLIKNTTPVNPLDPTRGIDHIEPADLNGDGKSDFVGINRASGTLQSAIGNGDGTFTAGTPVSVGVPATGLITGDFNLDGIIDSAAATTGIGGSILVVPGSNTGAFNELGKKAYSTGLNNVISLAAADVSGDNRTDLIALNATGSLVTLKRDALGTGFVAPGVITAGTGTASGFAVADINGDLIADAVVADTANNLLRIYLGNSDGSFTAKSTISFLAGSAPGSVRLGDITSDGKTDIVVVLPGIGQIAVVSGNNDGTFASAFRSLNAESVSDIRLADMTGDGKLDIVAALTNANSFAIFQYGQAVTINPVATKQGVLVLNGSVGRLQFNNNTNLNIVGPGKFTEGAFANQYKLVIQSDIGIKQASIISGGTGYRIGDTLAQDKNDRTGGAVFTVIAIDDTIDGSINGFGAITAVGVQNPGSNAEFRFDAMGNQLTSPTILAQANNAGLTHLTAFGPSVGTGAVLSIDPTNIGLASGLAQVQMQTPGKNTLSISGTEFGAGFQNSIFQGIGSLKLNNSRFSTFDKFNVNNNTSNYIFVQPGAGSLAVSNSSFIDAPQRAISMSGSGSLSITESLFENSEEQAINYVGGSTTILGSSFIANNAGAVQISGGNTTVTNTLFKDNIISAGTDSALSLNGTNATVTSSVFEGNSGLNDFNQTLGGNSGGAAILALGSPLTIKSSIFTGNFIDNISTMNSGGGAVYNFNSPLVIDQCGFEDNGVSITGYPSTIPSTSTTTVAFFNLNPDLQPSPRYSGGGALYSGGQTTITNTYFNLNSVDSQVDYWQQSPAEATNPTEPQYSGGGALYLTRNLTGDTKNTLTNVTFTQNNAIQTANRADASRSANSVSSYSTTFSPRAIVLGNKFRSGTVGTANDVITSYLNGIEFQENQGGTKGFNNVNVPTGTLGTFLTKGYLDDNLAAVQFEDLVLGDFSALTFLQSDSKTPIGFTKFQGNYPKLPLGAQPVGAALADMFQLKYSSSTFRNDLLVATRASGATPAQVRTFTLDEVNSQTTLSFNPSFAPVNLSFDPIDIQISNVTRTVSPVGEKEFVAFVTGYDNSLGKGVLQKFTITQVYQGVVNNIPASITGTIIASAPTYFTGRPRAMSIGNIDNTDSRDDVAISTTDSILVFDGPTLFQQASLNTGNLFITDIGDITLKDINRDNLPELLVTFGINFRVGVYYNTGSYDFSNQTPQFFACSAFPVSIDAADMYGKGTTQLVVATTFNNFDIINPTGSLTSTGRGLNGGAMIIADGRIIAPSTYIDAYAFYPGASNTTMTNLTVTGNSLVNQFATSINRAFTNPNIADTGGIFVDAWGPPLLGSSTVQLQNTLNLGNTGINYLGSKFGNTFVNTSRSYTGATFRTISTNMFNPATSPGYSGGYAGDIVQSDLQASTDQLRLRTEDVSAIIGLTDLLGGGDSLIYQSRIKTVAIDRLSPARDAGTDVTGNVPTDARGLNRKIGYAVDIGAYEVQIGTKISVQSPLLRPADSSNPNVYFNIAYGQKSTVSINTRAFDNVPLVDSITGRIDLVRSSDLQIIGTATLSPVDPLDKTKGSNAKILLNPRFDDLLATGKTTAFLRYPGDANNAVSETTPFDINVEPAPVNLTLNPVNFTNEAGGAITLTGVIDTPNSIAPLLGTVSISLVAPGVISSTFVVPIQYDSNDPSKGTYSLDLVPPLLNTLGNYTVTVNYDNGGTPPLGFSDKFVIDPTQAAVTSTFEVVKTPTINLSLPVVPVTRGNPLTLSATVIPPTTSGTNDPTPLDGIVEFLRNDGSVFATATLPTVPAFGPVVYSVTITNTSDPLYILPDVPNNTIVARYVRGSGFYQSVSSSPQYLNLVGVQTGTQLSPSGSLGNSPYGTSNTFIATLSGLPAVSNPIQPIPGSVVQLVANGATVIASQAYIPGTSVYTFSNLLLAPGTYGINARYTGDGLNYNASNSLITTVGITQATPSMVVAPINGGSTSVVAGAASTITLEATVTGATGAAAPSGRVQFLFDGIAQGAPVTLVGGKAVKIFSFPTARTGVATTQFLPTDGLYNPVSSTTTLSATTLTFASSTNSASRGASVTLAVFEQPLVASGSTVEFVLDNGTVLGQTNIGTPNMGSTGQYYQISLDTALPGSALINGNNSIYARYVGSNTRVGPIRLTVSQQSTTTALNAGATSGLVYGAALNLGASVNTSIVGTSAVPFTGTIQIVNLLTGTAVGPTITAPTLSLPTQSTVLPAGNYQLQAQYSGDNANFSGSISSTLSFTIAKANANVSSTTSKLNLEITESVTLTATLASDAGGSVQFLDNGVAIGTVSVSGGTASLKYTPTRIGKHTITTVYSGDSNYLATTTAAPLLMDVSGNDPFFAVAGQTGSTIKLYNAVTKTLVGTVQPLGATYTGGYRVATGDVTGDGVVDLVYSTASSSLVGVINGQSIANGQKFTQVTRFSAYSPNYTKPVNVAVGDINGDGFGDIIVAPGASGTSPLVRAFSGNGYGLLFSKLAYSASFSGGVSVAAADVNGDRKADIVCVPFTGTSAHIVVFNGANGNLMQSFIATGAGSTNGFSVAAADLNGDKRADIILGALAGSSKVSVIDGRTSRTTSTFTAFGSSTTGARVGVIGDITGDGIAEILTASGASGGGQVRRFNGANKQLIDAFFAFSANSPEGKNGLFIG